MVPPGKVRIHIAGIVSKRVVPQALNEARVRPVDHYPTKLAEVLRTVSPAPPEETCAVLLKPGPYNSAYFEHTFLARSAGIKLVQPADLYVEQRKVYLRTTQGPRRVHVIYRRIDEAFLDPAVFRPDSLLGVRGLIDAYRSDQVALVNAPGNGVADDKAVYRGGTPALHRPAPGRALHLPHPRSGAPSPGPPARRPAPLHPHRTPGLLGAPRRAHPRRPPGRLLRATISPGKATSFTGRSATSRS